MADYQRKEVIGDCTLYLGDCMEVMPTLGEFDAVVTDPPYGIDPLGAGYGREGRAIQGDSDCSVLGLGVRAAWQLVPRGYGAVFYSARNTPDIMRELPVADYAGEIIWNKRAPGMGGALRYQHENIALLSCGGATPAQPAFSILSHYRCGSVHPHEKPMPLMWEVCAFVGGERILDPFMGSGTTGVACVQLGRKFTGIELDPKYFDIACKRIEEAYKQPRLFEEPAPKKAEQIGFDLEADNG